MPEPRTVKVRTQYGELHDQWLVVKAVGQTVVVQDGRWGQGFTISNPGAALKLAGALREAALSASETGGK